MKLVRVYWDIALGLPLNDTEVYYSEDKKYKVITSCPFKSAGRPEVKLITIAAHPYKEARPPEEVCVQILNALKMGDAVSAETAFRDYDAFYKSGVRRFIFGLVGIIK